ncbi:MAG: ADP-heptose--LPS heptosyltransferase 2 [Cryomorphaceae bacterium]|nr:MAG: ADP-heptose--LPS heptosyltransferase 2 [Cryomorphaceae bacterium]
MSKKLKILVIRFSSIGDIILTTPILRCLKSQLNCDIDFLTNRKYQNLLLSNPNIREIYSLKDKSNDTINFLKDKEYDVIIDLQNNFRSLKIRLGLKIKSFVVKKENIKRYILIYFGVNLLNNHIVDRYFNTIENLKVYNDNQGIDYALSNLPNLKFETNKDYISWCIGGTHEAKKLSIKQISNVINKLNTDVVLIGGADEKKMAAEIINNTMSKKVHSFCGEISIEESAFLIKKSRLFLTNDTGMMHIASAFDSPIISFWGCTKPSLGFSAYMPNKNSENIIMELSKRPCSKHGKYCRFQSKGCIKGIDHTTIYKTITRLIK